jgi:hypothetical protein
MSAIHSETSRAYCLVVMLRPEPRRPVNRKLKKLLAEAVLDASTLKEMLGKNF